MADYHYTVYFEPLAEGGYQVVFPAIPEIITYGASLEEARRMAADALRCHLEGLLKDGEGIPVESAPGSRTERTLQSEHTCAWAAR